MTDLISLVLFTRRRREFSCYISKWNSACFYARKF